MADEKTQEIYVKMGKIEVTHNPHTLVALGLGSCVGVALYDSEHHIGGMAHVMLPDSSRFQNHSDKDKFADVAIPKMVDEMVRYGARKENIKAKIAGGAQMFAGMAGTEMDVSSKNIAAVRDVLKKENLPIIADDTGSNYGRTIKLNTVTGVLEVSTKMRERVYNI